MKLITRLVKRLLATDSPSIAHPAAPVLEAMEGRLLLSGISVNYYKMTCGPDGQPIEQRPTESLSLNYTKITF